MREGGCTCKPSARSGNVSAGRPSRTSSLLVLQPYGQLKRGSSNGFLTQHQGRSRKQMPSRLEHVAVAPDRPMAMWANQLPCPRPQQQPATLGLPAAPHCMHCAMRRRVCARLSPSLPKPSVGCAAEGEASAASSSDRSCCTSSCTRHRHAVGAMRLGVVQLKATICCAGMHAAGLLQQLLDRTYVNPWVAGAGKKMYPGEAVLAAARR